MRSVLGILGGSGLHELDGVQEHGWQGVQMLDAIAARVLNPLT
ncbi:MAG: hypothetical protein ABIT36_06015 [Steroidobacteraceae bacterium]